MPGADARLARGNGGGGPKTAPGPARPRSRPPARRVRRPKTEDNLDRVLSAAASLMARRGYEETSVRDVARETGFSLAGMYYYFKGKEELLYKIQDRTFATLLREQEELAAREGSAEERLRLLVCNHLSYLTTHANELKVCTFELESLHGDLYRKIERLRTRYYKLMAGLVADLMRCPPDRAPSDADVRHHTLFLFGILNWVFMWFDPKRDHPTEVLGEKTVDFVLRGLPCAARSEPAGKPSSPGRGADVRVGRKTS